jgi:hypothetical protein
VYIGLGRCSYKPHLTASRMADAAVVATSTDKPCTLKNLEDLAARREFFLIAAQKLRRRLRAGVPAGGGADGFKVPPVTHEIAAKVTAEALERLFPSGTTEGHCHICGARSSSLTAQLLSRAATADDATLALVACCRRCACDVRGGRSRTPRQPTAVPRRTTYSVWRRSAAGKKFESSSEAFRAFKELARVRKSLTNDMSDEELRKVLTPAFFEFTASEAKARAFNKGQRERMRDDYD